MTSPPNRYRSSDTPSGARSQMMVPEERPRLYTQSSTPTTRGGGSGSMPRRRMRRSTVSSLSGVATRQAGAGLASKHQADFGLRRGETIAALCLGMSEARHVLGEYAARTVAAAEPAHVETPCYCSTLPG